MEFTIPVGYHVKGRKTGRTAARKYGFSEFMTVELPEVDRHEAPIAVEWPETPKIVNDADVALMSGDRKGLMSTRWYDGRHWLKLTEAFVGENDAKKKRQLLSPQALEIALERRKSTLDLGVRRNRLDHEYAQRVTSLPTSEFDEVVSSDRDEARLWAEQLESRFIVVDDVLHMACAQPSLRATMAYHGHLISNAEIDFRGEFLDGWKGFQNNCLSHGFEKWENLPHSREFRGRPMVRIPESLDPDIASRRDIDTRVKLFVYRNRSWFEDGDDAIKSFLEDKEVGRGWRFEKILENMESERFYKQFREVIDKVLEIEDTMTVSLQVTQDEPPYFTPKP